MSPSPIQLLTVRDLTGGLNLRHDGFDVAPNESPDMLNVVLDSRGGFQMREGIVPINSTGTGNVIQSMGSFETLAGVKQIVVGCHDAKGYYSTGGNFTSMGVTLANDPAHWSFVQAQDKLYVHTLNNACRRWDGSTMSAALATTYNDTGTPSNAGVPQGQYGCYHMGRHWVGYTSESGTSYPSRVRYSYPANVTNDKGPEDFKTNSYIDIDPGGNTGVIVALVPLGDRLFVFKTNGVYVITGSGESDFAVTPISQDFGACGPYAVAASPAGIFFFDWPTGLHAIAADGTSRYLFEKLLPVLEDGTVAAAYQSSIAVGYNARKVWVSVPLTNVDPSANTRTYVLDLAIGGGARYGLHTPISEGNQPGAWTRYDFGCGGFMVWQPQGAASKFLGFDRFYTSTRGRRVWQVEGTGVYTDTYIDTPGHIPSYFITSWIDMKRPSITKRWKRPSFIINNDQTATIIVEIFKDYYAAEVSRSFVLNTTGGAAAALWDSAQWDVAQWSGVTTTRNSVVRGSTVGTAKSVRLKFTGPTAQNAAWGVQGFSLPFIPRQVR